MKSVLRRFEHEDDMKSVLQHFEHEDCPFGAVSMKSAFRRQMKRVLQLHIGTKGYTEGQRTSRRRSRFLPVRSLFVVLKSFKRIIVRLWSRAD